jgi:hypothetical protein
MPRTISPVVRGRCRPSPDRISEGASPDRDARRIVPGNCAVGAGQGLLPVLGAPPGGVGGVDGTQGVMTAVGMGVVSLGAGVSLLKGRRAAARPSSKAAA